MDRLQVVLEDVSDGLSEYISPQPAGRFASQLTGWLSGRLAGGQLVG